MIIHGRHRPKNTNSCKAKDIIPLASASFCMKAYHETHNRSRRLNGTFLVETSSKIAQYALAVAKAFA